MEQTLVAREEVADLEDARLASQEEADLLAEMASAFELDEVFLATMPENMYGSDGCFDDALEHYSLF